MHSLIDVDEFAEALIFGLACAGAVALLRDELRATASPPPEPSRPSGGRYVPAEAIDQADRGRTVTIDRLYGPDLELTADLDDQEE